MRQLTSLDSQSLALETRCPPACSPTRTTSSRPPCQPCRAADVRHRHEPRPAGLEPRHLQRAGAAVPLYCAGAKLVANYPVAVITHGMGLNITVMSYTGSLDFGIVADRAQMPDVALLMGWLGDELELLMPRAEPPAKRAERARSKPRRDVRA